MLSVINLKNLHYNQKYRPVLLLYIQRLQVWTNHKQQQKSIIILNQQLESDSRFQAWVIICRFVYIWITECGFRVIFRLRWKSALYVAKNTRQVKKTPDIKGDMSNIYMELLPLDGSHNKVMEMEWFRETQHCDETPSLNSSLNRVAPLYETCLLARPGVLTLRDCLLVT